MEFDISYPRPQLRREKWTDLCGEWQLAYDDENKGINEGWENKPEAFDRQIKVPFPPESKASGIGDTSFHPVVWYRRTFALEPGMQDGRLILHFGAVDYRARVWVNGSRVAEHEGGHTPFSADITEALDGTRPEQVIVVRAEDSPFDLTQPRGKQYWHEEPRRIWYDRTTGIWQPVWLEPVADTYITELRWTPDADRGLIGLQAKVNGPHQGDLQLRVRITLGDLPEAESPPDDPAPAGTLLADDTYLVQRQVLRREIALSSTVSRERLIWSPGRPNLLDAVITLSCDGQTLDEVHSYFGIRSAGFNNGRFLLNGRPYYLRLALEQGFWPESHLAAPSAEALKREVELALALGFNGVRIHQKVEDPRFLYWCDKLGLLVWGEMANAYVFSNVAVERLVSEWMEVLKRDYNHPCIVTWVPLNESWGVPTLDRDPQQQDYVRALYHLTHSLDATRPVIGNDGWEHLASDVLGVHDYALDGATIRERYGTPAAVEQTLNQVQPHYRAILLPGYHQEGEPVMLTECGGITYQPAQGELWWGYGTVSTPEAFLEKYRELIEAIFSCPGIAGFCYTQLTDTQQERNGLLTEDRVPKLDVNAVCAINTAPTRAIPGEVIVSLQATNEVTSFQEGTES